MSETDFLKLKKHDNVETNTEKFDIENYLNSNWDKINENAKKVNTDISNIKKEQETQNTNIEENNSKIVELQTEKAKLETELKEMQEDFYQNSIRGQASGEYIHVEDSSNCRAKIGIGGNSEQETRNGKNILELMEGTYSNNGITAVVKDGVITLNGTATAISFVGINLLKSLELTNNKTYHLSAFNEKTAGDSTNYCSLRINQDNIQVLFNKTNANGSITTNLKISYITIRTQTGITYNNFVVKPQLEIGNGTDTWEQGGVSPSLDYPSQVKAVGDNVNLFDITRYDYRNLAGADVQINDKTNFRISATSNGNANCAAGFKVMDLTKYAGKTLTIKAYVKSSTSTNKAFFVLRQNNADYTGTKSNELYDESQNTTNGSITLKYKVTDTVNDNNRYLFIWFYATRGVACNIGDYVDYKVKLAEGTEVGEYSSYGQGCVKVTKCNKNLINKNLLTNYQILEDTGKLLSNNTRLITPFIYLKKGTYSLSCNLSRFAYAIYNLDKSFNCFVTWKAFPNQIVLNSDCYIKIEFIINPTGSEQVSIKDITYLQLEKGNTTDYEEHEEQSYIMPVQKEILQGDYFDYDNEEEVHTWGKLVLNGTEKIGISGASTDEILAVVYDINNAIDGFGYSNCFLYSSQVALNKLNVYNNGNNLRVCVDKSKFVDLESFKSKIIELYNEGTPVVVYYKLVTPTRLKFTDEQKAVAKELNNARTYKNVTNITTDSKAILSLDYAKDLETLLNNTQALAVNNASEGV